MPFYRFVCLKCHTESSRLLSFVKAKEHKGPCKECEGELSLTVGSASSQAMEATDEYRGKSNPQGLKKQLLERSTEHFKKHELPRIIEKEGKEVAIRQGWLDIEGRPKK